MDSRSVLASSSTFRATYLALLFCIPAALGNAGCREPSSGNADATTGGPDASVPLGPVGEVTIVDDGTPVRQPCTNNFGTALTRDFGRLDGILVAVLDPMRGPDCNVDRTHVHLQILSKGEIYDVAINIDVATKTVDAPLTGMPWTDGWHTGFAVNYLGLGAPSTAFPDSAQSEVVAAIKADLATVNHISVYGVGYGPDGAHLIHRNGRDRDGAIVTDPLSRPAKWRLFKFSNQTF